MIDIRGNLILLGNNTGTRAIDNRKRSRTRFGTSTISRDLEGTQAGHERKTVQGRQSLRGVMRTALAAERTTFIGVDGSIRRRR